MLCPCREKNESSVLYHSNHKSNELDIKLDIRCTSETHDKPTLYKCKKCKLIFCGDGPDKSKLVLLSKKLKLNKYVIFNGWQKDIDKIYNKSKFFISE